MIIPDKVSSSKHNKANDSYTHLAMFPWSFTLPLENGSGNEVIAHGRCACAVYPSTIDNSCACRRGIAFLSKRNSCGLLLKIIGCDTNYSYCSFDASFYIRVVKIVGIWVFVSSQFLLDYHAPFLDFCDPFTSSFM